MKKPLVAALAAAIVLTGAYAAASWFAGREAEKQFRTMLEKSFPTLDPGTIESSYDRGVFSSTAVMAMRMPLAMKDRPSTLTVRLHNDITHGPLPLLAGHAAPAQAVIASRTELSSDDPDLAAFFEQVPELSRMASTTVVHLDGSGESNAEIAPFTRALKDGATLEWKGLAWKSSFSPGMTALDGEVRGDGVALRDASSALEAGAWRADCALTEATPGLYTGRAGMTLSSLAFAPGGQDQAEAFTLRELEMTSTSDVASGLMHMNLGMRVAALDTKSGVYGPAEATYVVNNFNVAAMQEAQREMQAMQREAKSLPPEELGQRMTEIIQRAMPAFLASSPSLALENIHVTTPQGVLSAHAKMAFQNESGMQVNNPLLALAMLQAEAHMEAAKPLTLDILKAAAMQELAREQTGTEAADLDARAAAQAEEVLRGLIESNVLKESGDNYVSTLTYDKGRILLNGNPVPMQMPR